MNKKLALVLLLAALAGCTSRNEYGDCIGLGDEKKPDLIYKLSVRNLVVGVIFFELIVPPVVVAVDETFCPIGRKQ